MNNIELRLQAERYWREEYLLQRKHIKKPNRVNYFLPLVMNHFPNYTILELTNNNLTKVFDRKESLLRNYVCQPCQTKVSALVRLFSKKKTNALPKI